MPFHVRIFLYFERESIMNRQLTYIIKPENDNLTIGTFLKQQGFSHPVITNLKKTPYGILKNGIWGRTSDLLHMQDELTLTITEIEENTNLLPVDLPLSIIYEDDDLIVLNKSANMPIHPSINNYDNTLANALAHYYKDQNSPFVMRCINRLDRDTTGLTIVAKNMLSAGILSRDMKNRAIRRTYYAIVEGLPPQKGTIDAPIARTEASVISREVNFETGQKAVTHYEVIRHNNQYSLVKLNLETGRTHQIRVHMNYIGHPLPGDFIYNPDFTNINRQALHAGELTFSHPITKEEITLIAPLPSDMEQLLNN